MLNRWFIPLVAITLIAIGGLSWQLWRNTHEPEGDVEEMVQVMRYELQNGLELVVLPNDKVPAVTHMVWVKAGGADDPRNALGLAHFLEHLLFTGTEQHPEGVYDRMIAERGGRHNAFTSYDYTSYYVTIAKEHLELVMALEADRFGFTDFNPEKAMRERNVIMEERKTRVDNRPATQMLEQLNAVQFLSHPYGRPLIGWAQNIERFTVEDAQQFFATYYTPSNMVLVVAGDVDPENVRNLAGKYYGAMAKAPAPKRAWLDEQPIHAERRVALRSVAAKQARFIKQITVPSYGTEKDMGKVLPYQVFAHLAGGDATSVLYQELVEKQKLVSSVSAYALVSKIGPGTLVVDAVPSKGVSLADVEAAIQQVLETMAQTAPSEADLARVKTQLSAEALYAQDGLEPLARIMGQLFVLGLDETYFHRWQEAVNAVTAQDVQLAARAVMATPAAIGSLQPEGEK